MWYPDSAMGGLTGKQQAFINAYLSNGFNATEAAREAGYEGNDITLASVGYENLRKPQIDAEVKARFNEATMSANEVLYRLSEIASGKVTDLVNDDGNFDLKLAKQRKKEHLLKKLKIKRRSKRVESFAEGEEDQREVIETLLVDEDVEFETYSAHEALRDLGKFHKLFADRIEHSNPDGSPLGQPIADALTKVYGTSSTDNQ
jgi:phage terminase small subunit